MPGIRFPDLARKIGLLATARPVSIDWPGGVVSFTFDDFPKSALAVGGNILERYGVRGTYYASMELAGTDGILGPMFDHDDIGAAHRAGHEIACHTYSHVECQGATRSAMLAEIRQNGGALSHVVEGCVPTNFAYPYGVVSVLAKGVLGSRFSSCRGIVRGINCGTADLADLRAATLYAGEFDAAETRRLVDRNRSVGGWLIFFSHDVSDAPSPFGCRPDQLETIVAYAAAHSAILPVREVIAGLAGDRRQPHPLMARCSFAMEKVGRRIRSFGGRAGPHQ